MALNFAYSHTGGQWVNESRSSLRAGSILSVVNTPPFMQKRNPYDPNEYDEQAYGARILNPLAANAADSNTNTDHINGSLGFTVDIFKGLKFKTTFGIELTNEHWDYYLDPISTSDGRGTKGRVEESFSRNFEWLFENLLTYDCSFNKHNLSILGGATQQRAQYNGSWMAGFDLAESYPDIHSISAANQLDKDACGSSASAWTLASFLGRVAYNYDSRYLLTVNFRADGSSRFAPGHRWGTFPSVSAGWRISGEKFMQPLQDIVTDLKLRAGWGMNGNQGGFGNYAYMASMSVSKLPVSEGNLYPGLAIKPGSAANKELTWEKTSQWNLGLDLTMFDSRLSFSVDAYYKKTTDLLLTVSLPENVVPSSVTWSLRFKRKKGKSVISWYELDEKKLRHEARIKEFSSYSEEWLDYIITCRGGMNTGQYDIIIGGVANDKVFDTIELFFDGLIDKNMAIQRLKYHLLLYFLAA